MGRFYVAIPFGEVSKRLSDIWKSLTDDQKQVYVDRSRIESETMHPMGLIEPESGKEEEKRHFEMNAFDDKDRIRRELEKVKQTCVRSERFME